MPVTVTLKRPLEADCVVLIVRVKEHVGTHELGEKDAVAPLGRPEADKLTLLPLPDTNATFIVLVTLWPAVTVLSPLLDNEKSNDAGGFCVVALTIDE